MPCMNSTSAGEVSGRVAVVEGGSLLLGVPGAPGCITGAGFAGISCPKTVATGIVGNKLQVSQTSVANAVLDEVCRLRPRPLRSNRDLRSRPCVVQVVTVSSQTASPENKSCLVRQSGLARNGGRAAGLAGMVSLSRRSEERTPPPPPPCDRTFSIRRALRFDNWRSDRYGRKLCILGFLSRAQMLLHESSRFKWFPRTDGAINHAMHFSGFSQVASPLDCLSASIVQS